MLARWLTLVVCLLMAVSLGAPRSSLAQAAPPPTPDIPELPSGGTRYLTIPAAAFQPAADDQNYQIHGRYLIHFGQGGQNHPGTYFAPVTLPQGALITKVTYFWKDPGAPGDTSASLYRSLRWTNNFELVAGVPSSYDLFPPSFGSTIQHPAALQHQRTDQQPGIYLLYPYEHPRQRTDLGLRFPDRVHRTGCHANLRCRHHPAGGLHALQRRA